MGLLAARTDADREMQRHLRAAAQSLRKALLVAQGVAPDADSVIRRRARNIVTQLRGAVSIVEGVGNMQPSWDTTDPDLLPEDQKRGKEKPKPPPQRPAPVSVEAD